MGNSSEQYVMVEAPLDAVRRFAEAAFVVNAPELPDCVLTSEFQGAIFDLAEDEAGVYFVGVDLTQVYEALTADTTWALRLEAESGQTLSERPAASDRDERFVEDPTAVTIHRATFDELLATYGETELAEDYANGGLSDEQVRAYEQHFNVDPKQGT